MLSKRTVHMQIILIIHKLIIYFSLCACYMVLSHLQDPIEHLWRHVSFQALSYSLTL